MISTNYFNYSNYSNPKEMSQIFLQVNYKFHKILSHLNLSNLSILQMIDRFLLDLKISHVGPLYFGVGPTVYAVVDCMWCHVSY